jgi:hypothetical protein
VSDALEILKGIGHPSTYSIFDKATRLIAGPQKRLATKAF